MSQPGATMPDPEPFSLTEPMGYPSVPDDGTADEAPLHAAADEEETLEMLRQERAGVPLETDVLAVEDAGIAEDRDPLEEDSAYFPPTDPIFSVDPSGNIAVLNGLEPSADSDEAVEFSADGTLGDEAIADAVRDALHRDAATTDLTIEVEVEDGYAVLRGTVPTLEDAENAEAVAGEVPGVEAVDEHLRIAG